MPADVFNSFLPLKAYFSQSDFHAVVDSQRGFFEALKIFDPDHALQYLYDADRRPADAAYWGRLHNEMLEKVPAYRSFKSAAPDDKMDKNNYLAAYPIREVVPDGSFDYMKLISVSSGSSGKPSFWPRGAYLELETTILYELLLRDFFRIHERKTLVVNAYSMGMYVAGVFTLNACLRIALRGYDMTVINPGISCADILRIIEEIGPNYDQIVICGYPPFVKDVVEEGIRKGIDWGKYPLRFIFGAESIGESWRSHLYKKAKITDYYCSSINTYGSADAAILGHETPVSIFIKRLCSERRGLLNKLFNGREVSTFVQYHPHLKHFEEEEGELICTTLGGLPLYRYNLHDSGAVYSFEEMVSMFESEGIDILEEARKRSIPVWRLPFIVLYGKSDQTVTLYGLNVYPQTIRAVLDRPGLANQITGRMQMATKYSRYHNQFLEIKVEVEKGVSASRDFKKHLEKLLFENLLQHNYEYRTLYEKMGNKTKPRVVLQDYGTITRDRGSKQKWII